MINKPILFMMVGLIGSGKSTKAEEILKEHGGVLIASDSYRQKEYGDEAIQGNNQALFEKIHADIHMYLSKNENVVFDATNTSRKNRISFLNKIKKLEVEKVCVLMATQYDICIVQNKNRERQVPEFVIQRMRENFNVPSYNEGWDSIQIEYKYEYDNNYEIDGLLEKMDSFNQENIHHRFTLGKHCRQVCDDLHDNENPSWVSMAGLLHDCGKLYTKRFLDSKGNTTTNAHYFNHENVGAYESIFFSDSYGYNLRETLDIALLIEMHMRMYQKTDKSVLKIKNIIGGNNYKYLEQLHEADRNAH